MNIIEATQKALEEHKAIYRKSLPAVQFIPTNSIEFGIVITASDNDKVGKRWNPFASDILAEDWEVFN